MIFVLYNVYIYITICNVIIYFIITIKLEIKILHTYTNTYNFINILIKKIHILFLILCFIKTHDKLCICLINICLNIYTNINFMFDYKIIS